MEKQAAALVADFVNEYIAGDWEKLKSFDFRELRNSDKYGCPDRNFDCDDCNLMRAVYVVLWNGCLPQLTLDNCGARRRYRGDTLNTFHTMFGSLAEVFCRRTIIILLKCKKKTPAGRKTCGCLCTCKS